MYMCGCSVAIKKNIYKQACQYYKMFLDAPLTTAVGSENPRFFQGIIGGLKASSVRSPLWIT